MYTNVPVERAINIIGREWNTWIPEPDNNDKPHMGASQAMEVIRFFISKGGYFLAGDAMYKQKEGLMMGASLSSAIAAIVINDSLISVEPDLDKSTLVLVYADDILMVGDPIDMGKVMQNFKITLSTMPFTVEREQKTGKHTHAIQYLELHIERMDVYHKGTVKGSTLTTCWKKKAYDSGCTLNFLSFHSWSTKRSLVQEMFSKAVNLTSLGKLRTSIEVWFDTLLKNDYPPWVLVSAAYDRLVQIEGSANYRRRVKKVLGEICSARKFNSRIPREMNFGKTGDIQSGSNKHPSTNHKRKAHIAFPMSRDMSEERDILKDLFPCVNLAPSTNRKNSDTIFTKIKERLGHKYYFNKVFSWKCPGAECTNVYVAIARANNIETTIDNVSNYKEGAYHKHWADIHGGHPVYPDKVKILSKINENGVAALDNRLQMEMKINPQLILTTSKPTYIIRKDILEAMQVIVPAS